MNYYSMTDESIAAEMGQRIEDRRLESNLSQAVVAEEVGISEVTYRNAVKGKVKLSVLIGILRSLGELDQLDSLLPKRPFSPVERMKLEGKKRQRASRTKPPSRVDNEQPEW